MDYLNFKAGDFVLFYDKEGESTFRAKFIKYGLDGAGRIYFTLEINGERHDLEGHHLPNVQLDPDIDINEAIKYWKETISFTIDNNDEGFDAGISQKLLDFLDTLKK